MATTTKVNGVWHTGPSNGSGGASTYAELPDKPKINNTELSGDKSAADLGLMPVVEDATEGNLVVLDSDGNVAELPAGTEGQVLTQGANGAEWADPTKPMVSITYSALKALRDAGELIPGRQYRITDYHTTTTQENTRSADHQFDIIVTADGASSLNENARACLHDGDTYFPAAPTVFRAWELKYCLDNDVERFAWAGSTNGKGVIYYMKDEWNNECPYDFKNIQFKRKLTDGVYDPDSGVDTWVYTFTAMRDEEDYAVEDASLLNRYYIDDGACRCKDNVIKEYNFTYSGDESTSIWLNNIVFLNHYSLSEEYYFECAANTFGNGCYNNTFGDNCYNNIFASCIYGLDFDSEYSNHTIGYKDERVGDLDDLETADKTNIVGAINEVKGGIPTLDDNVTSSSANGVKSSGIYSAIHPANQSSQPAGGMLPNVLYNLGELSGDVNIVLATPTDNTIANHYFFTFSTGATAPTIGWDVKITSWFGGSAPTINASKHYEVSVLNGVGVAMEV